jgi:uncharacterized protein with GYD domain
MPKYLIQASYTAEGAKGLAKDGGSKRRAVVQKVVEGLGGKLESFYFVLGRYDAIVIADLPDAVSVASFTVSVGASGAAQCSSTELLSVEQMDKACQKQTGYKAPGA